MKALYFRGALLLAMGRLSLGPLAVQAQTPAWQAAMSSVSMNTSGAATVRATTADALGNVYVTGYYSGKVAFAGSLLSSQGSNDVFVAKWDIVKQGWAWAKSAGGIANDQGVSIAVSGSAVYVGGSFENDAATATYPSGTRQVQFGAVPLPGVNAASYTRDGFVARLTDAGSSADWVWALAGGGTGEDQVSAVAANGSNVYVGGYINNNNVTSTYPGGGSQVRFGAVPLPGASSSFSNDGFVARLADAGSSADWTWAVSGGGRGNDQVSAVAVSGTSVYVGGYITNNNVTTTYPGGANQVQFGALPLPGASSATGADVLVARLTDAGGSATWDWAQAAGGTGNDQGTSIALNSSAVYVGGYITNSNVTSTYPGGGGQVQFGAVPLPGASSSSSSDGFVARLTDSGSSADWAWALAGGGQGDDRVSALAVSGTSVYVGGYVTNNNVTTTYPGGANQVQLGAVALPGASATVGTDVLVARLTDAGSSAAWDWALAGGGTAGDSGGGLAISGTEVYVGGAIGNSPAGAAFGPARNSPLYPQSSYGDNPLLAGVRDNGSSGSWQQVQTALTVDGSSGITATATDAAGNVFVTGGFFGQVSFGSIIVTCTNYTNDVFVAKWDAAAERWAWVMTGGGTGNDQANAIAVSGSSVYVSGIFYNNNVTTTYPGGARQVQFGPIPLPGASPSASNDAFVARLTDAGNTATWDWALAGGGTGGDQATTVAVRGGAVYVGGMMSNTNVTSTYPGGSSRVQFGPIPLPGMRDFNSEDLFVARVTESGGSASWTWAIAAGGGAGDNLAALAVNGAAVYISGYIQNDNITTNYPGGSNQVQFGTIPLPGASARNGADAYVARLNDAGSTASWAWALVGGGGSDDRALSLAVSGSSVYIGGYAYNNAASPTYPNGQHDVRFGPAALPGLNSAVGADAYVARLTDAGNSASWDWAVSAGGTGNEQVNALLVSGPNVYAAGTVPNDNNGPAGSNQVYFGAVPLPGASPSSNNDVFVARLTDAGSTATWNWALTGGSPSNDQGLGLALNGSNLYVGGLVNGAATFGSRSAGSLAGAPQGVLSRLTVDQPLPVELLDFTARTAGPQAVHLAWTTAQEQRSAYFAVERSLDGERFAPIRRVTAAGTSSTRRDYALTDDGLPVGASMLYYRLRQVDEDGTAAYSPVQAVRLGRLAAALRVWPSPTAGAATLSGATPGAPVQVLDLRGRVLLRGTADATGQAPLLLPASAPAGVYLVRSGTQAGRLVKH